MTSATWTIAKLWAVHDSDSFFVCVAYADNFIMLVLIAFGTQRIRIMDNILDNNIVLIIIIIIIIIIMIIMDTNLFYLATI